MIEEILGRKIGMTQVFDPSGEVVPVTIIQAGPCIVTQVKTRIGDGYAAVQLGFEETERKRLNRPLLGHLGAQPPLRVLREVRVPNPSDFKVGQQLDVSVFQAGDYVDVSGTSKGRGFAGGVKRHGFHGGPRTHGQSDRERAPGSIGAGTGTGRVRKGLRMAGRMGGRRVTVQRLQVVEVDMERNLLLVKGSVPGANGGLLQVRKSVKSPKPKRK
ncbi:MAG: 50S ribosomal protein L3 [Chloroflexia bacterium]|nr:50S ribosomal protein L3 [Chloroflexia bacterium]